jgi:hypothetical protein
LVRYIFPAETKHKVFAKLWSLGIRYENMFPDIEGAAKGAKYVVDVEDNSIYAENAYVWREDQNRSQEVIGCNKSFANTDWLNPLANHLLCSLQLPIQILQSIAEIVLLFSNQRSISKPINSSDQTPHHRISSLDRSPKSRLDCFALALEGPAVRNADPGSVCF